MRERIYEIVEKAVPGDQVSHLYDYFITAISILSLVPLMFKGTNAILDLINNVSVYILFMDYVLRWMTHDYRMKAIGRPQAFIWYPVTVWAICDILAIMPTLGLLGRQFRLMRMFRVVKILHYSKSFLYISNVFKRERKTLLSVLIIALAYIYVSALAMFNYEPDTFPNFFDALYWATTALTTVGYGDVYPVSEVGRLISMISSLFGIAVIALPAGIVTAGFMDELNREAHGEAENTDEQ